MVQVAGRSGAGLVEGLFRRHYAELVRALAVGWGDEAGAADAVQHAFGQAWRDVEVFSGYEEPVAWLRRVAVNHLRNQARSRSRGERALARLSEPGPVSPPSGDRVAVADAVRGLPDQQRLAVALFYLFDLSVAEVAETMELSAGAVKYHLHEARNRLREALEDGHG